MLPPSYISHHMEYGQISSLVSVMQSENFSLLYLWESVDELVPFADSFINLVLYENLNSEM